MTDDLRRQDDIALAGIDKRLALLEQAHGHQAKLAEARSMASDRALEALGVEVKSAIVLWQTVTAEPQASPAGRALASDIEELRVKHIDDLRAKVDEHDDFMQQVLGTLRLARFALGTSLLALVVSVFQIARLAA